jgi:CxxC motif-containing protein (DUF1111 family)
MKFRKYTFIAVMMSMVMWLSCTDLLPEAPKEEAVLDGPLDELTGEQYARFLRGDVAFARNFTADEGLGPNFVTSSCISCHAGDGKGHPSTTLTRFGQADITGNTYLHLGGPQLQNRALPGHTPELLPIGAPMSRFTAPAVTGLGYLSLVTDQDVVSWADPNDANGDGISGRAHWIDKPSFSITNPEIHGLTQSNKVIGRFGKKAAAFDLLHQTVNAYNEDMGLTSLYNPIDVATGLEIDPEITTKELNDVVFYLMTLKAPIQRDADNTNVTSGRQVFSTIGCASCHRPSMTTSKSNIAALSEKTFYPYTDLLLHDMGSRLDDGYTEGGAVSAEWRTPALWGLGLSAQSQGGKYYLLHDGRARSIDEAINYHGGEGEASQKKYNQLNAQDKSNLIQFLESL